MTRYVRAELLLALRALRAARCHSYRAYLSASGELSVALEDERAGLNAQISHLSRLLRGERARKARAAA